MRRSAIRRGVLLLAALVLLPAGCTTTVRDQRAAGRDGSRPAQATQPTRSAHPALVAAPAAGSGGPARPAAPAPGQRVIAHRGNTGGPAFENTLDAFRAADAAGLDWFETDVRLTADGVPVLLHDPAVPRWCTGPAAGRPVATVTATQFTATSCGSHHNQLTTLAALVGYLRPRTATLLPEVKVPGSAGAVLAVLDGLPTDRYVVQSFLPADLITAGLVTAGRSGTRTCLLSRTADARTVATAARTGVECVALPATGVTGALVTQAHQAGLRVFVWTVNDPATALRLRAAGVDAVISDNPDLVRPHRTMTTGATDRRFR